MLRSTLFLTPDDRTALEHLQHTAALPYLRERAAALLKIADGQSATQVARTGLLQRRKVSTVCTWLARYQAEGIAGLTIRPGRGRTPAFSPSAPARRRRAHGPAAPAET